MATTIYAKDFGILPNSGNAVGNSFTKLAESFKGEEVTLVLENGIYNLNSNDCVKKGFYITNTAPESAVLDITRNIGLYFENIENLTIDGNGAVFLAHGDITPIALYNCKNVKLKNFSVEYASPAISEMTVEAVGRGYIDAKINNDCKYKIENGKLFWLFDSLAKRTITMQICDREKGVTYRMPYNYNFFKFKPLENGNVRCCVFPLSSARFKVGQVVQSRFLPRTEVGVFVYKCDGISFENANFCFMQGIGITGQCSKNLSFDNISCAPSPKTNRTTAGFADFMHFSTCGGKISITNSNFDGAHDDVINVHGGYLMISKICNDHEVVVNFPHKDTYGFDAFDCGDEVEFVKRTTLEALGKNTVKSAELLNPRQIKLVLKLPLDKSVKVGVGVENTTATPELYVDNCKFKNIPTRGILVTTRKKVVISNNIFDKTGMSGVLISNDIGMWYESGRVQDVTICGNTFACCGHQNHWATVLIKPENISVNKDKPVHKNIKIENNNFQLSGTTAISAKCAKNIEITNNT
ncbi:MAG: right-handed parallel beta-helix repeat-containing protein, partial [Clostridia bacterium]